MLAYAEGKEVEFKQKGKLTWKKTISPNFDWFCNEYRIKQEATYRPFKDKEECWAEMQKHQPFGWVKCGNKFINILKVSDTGVDFLDIGGFNSLDYVTAIKRLNFIIDGTPFGIKEE